MAVQYIPLTISISAYSTGDVVGGKILIGASNPGLLTSLALYDADGEGVQLDFFFFDGTLTGTYTDNAAFAVDAADMPKFLGNASILVAEYIAAGSDKTATKAPLNIPIKSGGVTLIIVIRSTTTYTATTDLRLTVGIVE
jgi:hypothetical protein